MKILKKVSVMFRRVNDGQQVGGRHTKGFSDTEFSPFSHKTQPRYSCQLASYDGANWKIFALEFAC